MVRSLSWSAGVVLLAGFSWVLLQPRPLTDPTLAAPHRSVQYATQPWDLGSAEPQSLQGRVAIVVGGSSGIGKAVARGLLSRGCEVIITSRSLGRAKKAAADISTGALGGDSSVARRIQARALDLADLADVRRFARSFLDERGEVVRLNYLVLNAGMGALFSAGGLGWAGPWLSPQGYEQLYAANYLGHFQLLQLLLPALGASEPARVTATSSILHWWHDADAVRGARTLFPRQQRRSAEGDGIGDRFRQYGNTKLAQILMCFEAQRRFQRSHGISFTPLAPGLIDTAIGNPNLQARDGSDGSIPLLARSTEDGALTTLHALLSDAHSAERDGGGAFLQPYWSPPHQAPSLLGGAEFLVIEALSQRLTWGLHRWRPHPDAFHRKFAEQLWDASVAACEDSQVNSTHT